MQIDEDMNLKPLSALKLKIRSCSLSRMIFIVDKWILESSKKKSPKSYKILSN
jgi:hypothetical protein